MRNDNEPSEETKNEWENDPDNWIWGMFYYNPKDKRSYFPKRIKEFGWHANYADPNYIVIVLLLVAVIVLFIKYAR
ncbi:hypothetical protein SD960_15455 [Flavobacterium sp. MMLR14_040]|uniref:hypothetical protein n=1 Tax=Flavobacterium sp. MMLR14_040 TaxID=3093843 RepID=UPI0029906888|nr:hypothetical protein [Flavobacterium sp. MMLR14_040]MDW8851501.1 hypothetical protein [Flavobacterium sp. MMLR14_040]